MNRTGLLAVVLASFCLLSVPVMADTPVPAAKTESGNAAKPVAAEKTVQTKPLGTPLTRKESSKTVVSKEAVTGAQILQLITGLVGILLLILFMSWVIRRGGKIHLNRGKGLDIVSVMPMGAREKVVLLQVGEEQILIGVSQAGGIRKLHKLENNVDLDAPAANSGGGFQEKLRAVLGKGKSE